MDIIDIYFVKKIVTTKIISAIKKSTNATSIDDIGIIKRGKYIFFIIFALVTILLAALLIPLLKTLHNNIPLNANTGYGIDNFVFSEMESPRNNVNTTVINNGCSMAHINPKTVCLYLTFISLQVKK